MRTEIELMRLDAIAASFHEQNGVATAALLHLAATLRYKWMRTRQQDCDKPRTLRATNLPSNPRTAMMFLTY